ncbi:unnamed protein product [Ixodes hexagonus]
MATCVQLAVSAEVVAVQGRSSGGPGFFHDDADDSPLLDRIRDRSGLAQETDEPDSRQRNRRELEGHGRVSSAVPCDLFNRTEWSCWLQRPRNTLRLMLRVSLQDEGIPGHALAVAWKRKHKIRGQNLYAVEDITGGQFSIAADSSGQQDQLAYELNPLSDLDRYLNKIQALVYLKRNPDSRGPAMLLYGGITYIIDVDPVGILMWDPA